MSAGKCISWRHGSGFRVVCVCHLFTIFSTSNDLKTWISNLTALYGMPSLREIRDILLFAHSDNLINDEEFWLLYDINKSSNVELPYWTYGRFDLDVLTDDECKSEFIFYKNDVYLLTEVLQVPDEIRCYNRVVVDRIKALCIFLKRFAHPCRYSDMLPRFARPVPQLCMISNQMMDFIYQTHNHRLRSFNQPWLSLRPVFRTMPM